MRGPPLPRHHLLEIDHIKDWAWSHQTALDDLAWLCDPDHDRKTRLGYRLDGPPGRRRWLAPDGTLISADHDSDQPAESDWIDRLPDRDQPAIRLPDGRTIHANPNPGSYRGVPDIRRRRTLRRAGWHHPKPATRSATTVQPGRPCRG